MDIYSISLQIYKKIPNPANVKTLRYFRKPEARVPAMARVPTG